MSSPSHPIDDEAGEVGGVFARLPQAIRPLGAEREGRGTRRTVETAFLLLLVLVLAVASVYDVTRQARINYRLTADIATWHELTGLTGHYYKELDVEQNLTTYTNRDIVCGNTSHGKPGARQQICLIMKGPIVKDRREATGGFFLPPNLPDKAPHRYGCFGAAATEHLCGMSIPRGVSATPPKRFGG